MSCEDLESLHRIARRVRRRKTLLLDEDDLVQEAVLGRLRGRKTNPGRLMIEAIRTTEHALTGSHRYRDTLGNPRIRTWRLGLRPHHLSLEAPGATQEDETAESFTALDSSIARWKEKELREMVREAVSKLDIIYRRIFEDRLNG